MSQFDDAYSYLKAGMKKFPRSRWDAALRAVQRERLSDERAAIKAGRPEPVRRKPLTEAQKWKAYRIQKGLCWECKEHFPIDVLEDDHLEPIAEGGGNQKSNRRLLCGRKGNGCNQKKSDRTPLEHSKKTGRSVLSMIPPQEDDE